MENLSEQNNKKQNYLALGEVFSYIKNIFKKKKNANFNVRMMHGVNRISIILFAIAILIWTIRRIF